MPSPRNDERRRAAQEALFCESLLAKSGTNILLETLRSGPAVAAWTHYPPGDVVDRESGAQWYYHAHPPEPGEAEHGHFHCFLRPAGIDGPIHHLVALGVDPYGRLLRIFTVNQWVVGDTPAAAAVTVPLLERFDVQLALPSYLVNRWLTAIVALFQEDIADLIRTRDAVLARHGAGALDDRSLEVTSEFPVDLQRTAAELGVKVTVVPAAT